jgi:hypothetical protein
MIDRLICSSGVLPVKTGNATQPLPQNPILLKRISQSRLSLFQLPSSVSQLLRIFLPDLARTDRNT